MRAVVELNGYAELRGGEPVFRPLTGSVRVSALPATVVLRTVWRTEPDADAPPGYFPFARLVLEHAEPDEEPRPTPSPELFRTPLERWDGASIIFAAYRLALRRAGEHRLLFPRTELATMTLRVRSEA